MRFIQKSKDQYFLEFSFLAKKGKSENAKK